MHLKRITHSLLWIWVKYNIKIGKNIIKGEGVEAISSALEINRGLTDLNLGNFP